MKRVLLLFMLAAPALGCNPEELLSNIRPLQAQVGEDKFQNFCTAWATRTNGFVQWVTAAHCALKDDGTPDTDFAYFIDGVPARLHSMNIDIDLAILEGGPQDVTGLKIATKVPPVLGDGRPSPIWAAGYPFGSVARYFTAGVYSNPRDPEDGRAIFNVAVGPGMSGSPVLYKDRVVGVLQQTVCYRMLGAIMCPVSRGARLDEIRLILYGE